MLKKDSPYTEYFSRGYVDTYILEILIQNVVSL